MYRPFRFAKVLLILGVVLGFGSGFASLAHHHRWHACHSEWKGEAAAAPQPAVVPQAAPQIIVVSPPATPSAAPIIVTTPAGVAPVAPARPTP